MILPEFPLKDDFHRMIKLNSKRCTKNKLTEKVNGIPPLHKFSN